MKATIKYSDISNNKRQKTINVTKNEPNAIIRQFIEVSNLPKYTYITTVKCGRVEYQWFGPANGAFS